MAAFRAPDGAELPPSVAHPDRDSSAAGVSECEESLRNSAEDSVGETLRLDDGVDFFAVQGARDRARLLGETA